MPEPSPATRPTTCRTGIAAARLLVLVLATAWLAGCTMAQPRTDDPWESFNRKTYQFNQQMDEAVIRPVAVGYRKITNRPVRTGVRNFFGNLQMPITIGNDLLQGQGERALKATGRFLINSTIGLAGFLDPAAGMGLPGHTSDFGVTLARWGVPDGPYLVLPFFGPTTARDVWKLPVDSYLFDPLSWYSRHHQVRYHAELLPGLLYLVSLRASVLDAESFLTSAYDPYVFRRDAYRQRRLYKIYYGQPPIEVIERMQGLDNPEFDPEELLMEQREWERKQQSGKDTSGADHPADTAGQDQP